MKVLSTIILSLLLICSRASAEQYYTVLVRQSPVGAGRITPGIGAHQFDANDIITLTTVPKTGYKFVQWLGDVSDPTTNRTQLSVDAPKIVIAVFERDSLELTSGSASAGSGATGLTPQKADVGGGGGFSGNAPPEYDPPSYDPPTPIPPSPIPEPSVVIMLLTGTYMTYALKRSCHSPNNK